MFLTGGITLGSWWSYYELGWGGWWFWDPVENSSFMPWLMTTALLHSLAVTERRGIFKSWTVLLAISAFSLSLLGTFLTRSPVLVSVHAFASDPDARHVHPRRCSGSSAAARSCFMRCVRSSFEAEGGFKLVSREAFLLANNILLVIAAIAVLCGHAAAVVHRGARPGQDLRWAALVQCDVSRSDVAARGAARRRHAFVLEDNGRPIRCCSV